MKIFCGRSLSNEEKYRQISATKGQCRAVQGVKTARLIFIQNQKLNPVQPLTRHLYSTKNVRVNKSQIEKGPIQVYACKFSISNISAKKV